MTAVYMLGDVVFVGGFVGS